MYDSIEINLLPAEYRVHKRSLRIQREIFYPVVIGAVAFVSMWVWNISLNDKLQTLNNEIRRIEDDIRRNEPIEKEIERLSADKAVIEGKIRALERINVNREKWVRLLEVLAQYLPDYTWLISIEEKEETPSKLSIEGRTHSFPQVANYMARLKECEYITDVDLSDIEQIDEKNRVFRFRIQSILNPDAGLEK